MRGVVNSKPLTPRCKRGAVELYDGTELQFKYDTELRKVV
jgi:hypothetical protein